MTWWSSAAAVEVCATGHAAGVAAPLHAHGSDPLAADVQGELRAQNALI